MEGDELVALAILGIGVVFLEQGLQIECLAGTRRAIVDDVLWRLVAFGLVFNVVVIGPVAVAPRTRSELGWPTAFVFVGCFEELNQLAGEIGRLQLIQPSKGRPTDPDAILAQEQPSDGATFDRSLFLASEAQLAVCGPGEPPVQPHLVDCTGKSPE